MPPEFASALRLCTFASQSAFVTVRQASAVNSQGEVSCDAGIFGRSGSKGSQLSTGTGCGYGITPHITANVFLPATFGSGSLPESRIYPGSEWSAGASWRFLHSVTSVGKRIESTASLGVVARLAFVRCLSGPHPAFGCHSSVIPVQKQKSSMTRRWTLSASFTRPSMAT